MSTTDTPDKESLILDPDARLMMQVKQGDEAAFEELMEHYQNRVLTVLFNALGQREEAEDLTQEVFLRVYRARHGYQPTAKFSTWVFTIANNLASNARRAHLFRKTVPIEARESGPLGPRPAEQLAESTEPTASGELQRGEVAQIVREAVGKLNERQRMAVLLNKFEDMSYEEIAQVMDLSLTAVKSLLSRARTNLREILEPYLDVI